MILSGSIWEIDALGTFGELVRWGPLGNWIFGESGDFGPWEPIFVFGTSLSVRQKCFPHNWVGALWYGSPFQEPVGNPHPWVA